MRFCFERIGIVPVGKYSSLLYYIVSCRFEKKKQCRLTLFGTILRSQSRLFDYHYWLEYKKIFVFFPWFVACIIVTVTLTVNKIVINNWFRLRP